MNIYDFAMNMEMDGKKYYLELMEKAENKGVQVLFSILAQEEQAHFDILNSLSKNVELGIESKVLDMAENIFKMMFEKTDQVKTMLSEDALIHALKLESESIKFYKKKLLESNDAMEKKVYSKLVSEESKHYVLVENLLDHISGGLIRGIESAEFQQLKEKEVKL